MTDPSTTDPGTSHRAQQRVEVSFVGAPPAEQVARASGVSDVVTDGSTLRCLVHGSFQPFLEALRGYEVVGLRPMPVHSGASTDPSEEAMQTLTVETPQTGTVKQSPRNAARVAGVTYLVSFAIIASVEFGVHWRLFHGDPILQPPDAAETARQILAHQSLYRLSIALELLYPLAVVLVLAAFYVILRPWGRSIALAAAACRILFAAAWIASTAQLVEALRLVRGEADLGVVGQDRLSALASLAQTIRWDYYYFGLLFWGVSTALFSYLWLRSGYIPRAFAAIGIGTAAWATVCAFAFVADPAFSRTVNLVWFDTPLVVFESVLSVWLLVRPPRTR